jgi:hypothetical protein
VRRTAAALAVSVSLLASSCSTTLQGTATAAGGSAPGSADSPAGRPLAADGVPTQSLQPLALTASDFPAPYQLQPLPQSEALTAQFSPAECSRVFIYGNYADLSKVGASRAVNPASSSTLTALVVPVGVPLEQVDAALAACSSFNMTAGSTPATGTVTRLPDPVVSADRSLAFTLSEDADAATPGIPTYAVVVMLAELRGLVVVTFAASNPANVPDRTVVTTLLTKPGSTAALSLIGGLV